MMKILSGRLHIVFILILALTAGTIFYITIKRAAPTYPVVIATHNMAIGAQITESDVTIKNLPVAAVPGTSFSSTKDVLGMTVAGGPILANDMVRQEHLTTSSSLYSTLQSLAPTGWVAAQIQKGQQNPITLQGLKRGDQVDIYGEIGMQEGVGVGRICQGAIVLAVPNDEQKPAQQFIVAVPPQYAAVISEIAVRNKQVSIVLPDRSIAPETQPTVKP